MSMLSYAPIGSSSQLISSCLIFPNRPVSGFEKNFQNGTNIWPQMINESFGPNSFIHCTSKTKKLGLHQYYKIVNFIIVLS